MPIRVVFVLTEFVVGGAEMMLWKLLSRIDRARFQPFVIALSPQADFMLEKFMQIGVECRLLGIRPRIDAVAGLWRLARLLAQLRPDVVQGWMYHGNLAATIGTALARLKIPVVWNVRGALIDRPHEKRLSSLIVWLGGKLSSSPMRIVNNSMVSALQHEQRLGYRPDGRVILPNGFDTEQFRPSPAARRALRDELGLGHDTMLVGLIGRYHPMKDHGNFIKAASILKLTHPQVHFVLAGEKIEDSNAELRRTIDEYGPQDRVHLLGQRDDMPLVTASLDVSTSSSSSGEGFPNVIGEAMSCAVPCVVTDVGDSAAIVADTGVSVTPRNSQALASAIGRVLELPEEQRRALGTRARQRVVDNFSLDSVVRSYEELYATVLAEYAGAMG